MTSIRWFCLKSGKQNIKIILRGGLIALVILFGAIVPSFAEEELKQTFTCTAKTFNECLMEAPCDAWKRLGQKQYQLNTKIIYRGNPVEGETISGGTIGDILETKCGKK